ncbi:MAG: replication initiation protein [Campylobacterales bacterium]|nr:replication initiation protein [Campylobacterales bacterium]MBD3822563.1 replication initiation protein [Thiotrichales bacterium]
MSAIEIMAKLNAKVATKAKPEENTGQPPKEKHLERTLGRHSEGANVKMSNALISATHGLNLGERRLVYLGMAFLNKGNEIQINAKDYAEAFGIDEANAYGQIAEACSKLFEREIRFTDGRKTTRARWVQSATYHEGEGWCSLKFTDVVCVNIKGLQTQYTRYALAKAGDLKSVYSWRLMERFLQYGDAKKGYKGWWQISIVELCEFLELSDFYLDWRQLRQKILVPAAKELLQKDNWEIEIEPLKTGRKTTHVKFSFKQKAQQKLDF